MPVIAWMAVIYWLSDQPDIPHAANGLADFALKKVLHAAGYAGLALLWRRALAAHGVGNAGRWAWLLAVAYAITDEWHQTAVPGRSGRPLDVAIDAVGAAIGLAWRWPRRRSLWSWRPRD